MKARVTIKCDNCGCRFGVGNTNGLPNGMAFIQKDNTSITLCQKCIMKIEEEGEDFFTKLKAKMDGKGGEDNA